MPPDAYSRTWIDYEDDLDAEALNDLEARMQARFDAGGGGGGGGDMGLVVVTDPDLPADRQLTGDGATDDLPAWNNLISDLNSNTFGTVQGVWFPPGVYIFDGNPDIITVGNIGIFGAGAATILRKDSGSASGMFFRLGSIDGADPVSYATISGFHLDCNQTTNYPPNNENAIHLNAGGHIVVSDLIVEQVGGLIRVGNALDVDSRVQRYAVHNVIGTFNCNTPNPDRINVLNGTNGTFTDIEIIGSNPGVTNGNNLQGGTAVRCAPPDYGSDSVNNDEHKFTNVHIQGGTTHWFEADVTHGDCFNWTFKHCTMDGSQGNTAYLHCDSGANTITDMHFLDCHVTTRSGVGLNIFHQGSGDWRSIQWLGGRIKYLNDRAVSIHGSGAANIRGLEIQSSSFLHDRATITSSTNSSDQVHMTPTAAEPGHYLSVGDEIVFTAGTGSPGTLPGGITAGTHYYVHTIPDAQSFTLTTTAGGGGSTLPLTDDWSGQCTYQIVVQSAVLVTETDGTRIQGNHFGPFYGVATTLTDYAVQGASTPTYYSIQGNTARGMVTAFSTGVPDDAGDESTHQNRNNVTDT